MEEAGQRVEGNGLLAAVKVPKNLEDRQSRSTMGIRNEDEIVLNSENEKSAVLTRYLEKLYNPPMNAG